MSFETIAKQYLSDLQKEVEDASSTGAFTPELSYRPLLDTFLRKLTELINLEAKLIFEPKKQAKAGRPDWRFYNSLTLGVYGYAEAKGLDIQNSLNAGSYKEQVEKYLKLGHKVILTDGIDFIFFDPKTKTPTNLSLVNKPIVASYWADLQPNLLIEARLRSFLRSAGFRRCSEVELVKEVAKRASVLSKSVEELAEAPLESDFDELENRAIDVLHQLKLVLEKHHDPVLKTSKAFADFVAQVLVFGLLYAHRVVIGEKDTPLERDRKLQEFWSTTLSNEHSERLRPFRALIEMLGEELESLSLLGVWFVDCRLLLAYVELEEMQRKTPDYHILYESFLSVFDPQTRFDYGAFYTPPELAEFAVRLTQAVVETELPEISLYEPGNKLIDPCCGTGTFLERLIMYSQGNLNGAQVIGFEILPAPYALAHYRLTMLHSEKDLFQNLSIILTNTLGDELEIDRDSAVEDITNDSLLLIEEEQSFARALAKPPLTLVIGNPPSSDSSPHTKGMNFTIIQRLLEDFRPPADRRRVRQNTQKQLQNDFVKFLRWACEKLLSSHASLFALVLPSSFAKQSSYLYARKWLAERFSKLWVLDIDLDARTGTRTQNLFNVMQGRTLFVGFRLPEHQPEQVQVFYRSMVSLTKQQKRDELSRERDATSLLGLFSAIPQDRERYRFRPSKSFDEKMYSHFWALHPSGNLPLKGERYIFQRHSSGVKLGSSSMFVHVDKQVLFRRCQAIADERKSVDELKRTWFKGQDKPPSDNKFSSGLRAEMRKAIMLSEPFRLYNYRPFVNVYALISTSVLRIFSGVSSGTRLRPEVLSAFEKKSTIGIAVAPSPEDIGDKLHRFVSFCWTLPDNDLCARDNAHVFCNQFPEYKKPRLPWNSTPIDNISPDLIKQVNDFAGNVSGEDMLFYVYGILCSNLYLETFEGVLHDINVIPRIPIVKDIGIFRAISDKGRMLAELEKPELEFTLTGKLADLQGLFEQPFSLQRYKVDLNVQHVVLYNETGRTMISIGPIARCILEFKVSGYSVIAQWLKVHSFSYTRTQFSRTQYHELLRLLQQIEMQMNLVAELDKDLSRILSGDFPIL